MATASDAQQQANRSVMDPKRLMVIFYLLAGLVVALFLAQVLELLWVRTGWSNPEIIEGLGWNLTTLVGVLLAAGAVVVCLVHPRIHQLSVESASELMKVTWPTFGETRVNTVAVVVAAAIAAAMLFGIDTLAYQVMVDWLPALWGKL
jgi:preprotein translocase subunit SecE